MIFILILCLGLNAAKSFLERFSRELDQLDLNILLGFEPFEEMIKEKLDAKPELFLSMGLSVAEYLKQATAHDTRLFIWALEEHRDQYVHFHSILDKYFDVMGTYSIFHYFSHIVRLKIHDYTTTWSLLFRWTLFDHTKNK